MKETNSYSTDQNLRMFAIDNAIKACPYCALSSNSDIISMATEIYDFITK